MATGASSSRFILLRSSVYQSWVNFDLTTLQGELDATATELADRQDKSEASRKKLVELSREFKRTASEDVVKSVIPLLKSFQGEIDALLRRSKLSESAFLSVYEKLINLPDPVSLLKAVHWDETQTTNRETTTATTTTTTTTTASDQSATTNTTTEEEEDDEEEEEKEEEEDEEEVMTSEQRQRQHILMDNNRQHPDSLKMSDNGNVDKKQQSFEKEEELEQAYEEKERHLQDSYALLAMRLHEAECHVMALKTALDSTKSELVDMSTKYEAAVQVDRSDNFDKRLEPGDGDNFDRNRVLRIVEDRLRNRSDFDEIRSAVSDALSFCARATDSAASTNRSLGASHCSTSDAEAAASAALELRDATAPSRQFRAEECLKDGSQALDFMRNPSQSFFSASSDPTTTFPQITDHPNNKVSVKTYPDSTPTPSTPSSSTSCPLPLDHYLVPSPFPMKVSHPERPSSHAVTLDLLPEALNVQKLAAKTENLGIHSLDTADVAQRIREILSAHNIGQRLFARHVLGLSQGTVSELLSKPKHWDKLTEKGRESYRRMHVWACDDRNIMALKAYAPKKGSSVVLANYEQDDAATEERIAQILCEAQVAMRLKQSETKGEAVSTMVASIYQQELAKLSQSEPDTSNSSSTRLPEKSSTHRAPGTGRQNSRGSSSTNNNGGEGVIVRGRKPQTDGENLTQDIIARIYQEELMKLAAAAEASGNVDELNVYRRELERLSTSSSGLRSKVKSTDRKDCEPKDCHRLQQQQPPIKTEQIYDEDDGNEDGATSAEEREVVCELPQDLRVKKDPSAASVGGSVLLRHSGSAFSLVRPRSTRQESESPKYLSTQTSASSDISPLQQMQSIANSLLTKSQRPLRAILPPITQDQINKYSNVNTDELVRRVKEMLSQYSISQRLFGENVLGLSQGSVSDLLARPKPWYMLTQKGREPFIRMQIFLEDEEAITKLVVTQFQIPPEKLMRNNSVYSESNTPGYPLDSSCSSASVPPNAPLSSSPLSASIAYATPNGTTACSTSFSARNSSSRSSGPSPVAGPLLGTADSQTATTHKVTNHSIDAFLDRTPLMKSEAIVGRNGPAAIHHNIRDHASLGVQSAMAMILPAAFSFAPAYLHPGMLLGLQHHQFQRQSSAELPSPPTPGTFEGIGAMAPQDLDTLEITTKVKEVLQFHNLGQKLFGEAVLGLSQGSVSELLSKPKPWHLLSLKGREPFFKMHLWLMDPLSIDRLKMFQDQLKAHKRKASGDDQLSDSLTSQKKPRVFFSEDQKLSLHQAYAADPYPNQNTLDQLAKDLGVGTKTVVNWFHNHRMRAKHQQGLVELCLAPSGSPSGDSSGGVAYALQADLLPGDELSNMSDEEATSTVSGVGEEERRFDFKESGAAVSESSSVHESGSGVDRALSQSLFPSFETVKTPVREQDVESSCNRGSCDFLGESTLAINDVCSNSGDSGSKHQSPVSCSATKADPHALKEDNQACVVSTVVSREKERHCVNKRKSAKPQWMFEGTVLDRSNHCVVAKNGCEAICRQRDDACDLPLDEECLKEVASSLVGDSSLLSAETRARFVGDGICNGKS